MTDLRVATMVGVVSVVAQIATSRVLRAETSSS
jgi:hypothetical protein